MFGVLGYGQNFGTIMFMASEIMYNDIKSCIAVNGEFSDFFQSCRGVKQGENVSPIWFSIFFK